METLSILITYNSKLVEILHLFLRAVGRQARQLKARRKLSSVVVRIQYEYRSLDVREWVLQLWRMILNTKYCIMSRTQSSAQVLAQTVICDITPAILCICILTPSWVYYYYINLFSGACWHSPFKCVHVKFIASVLHVVVLLYLPIYNSVLLINLYFELLKLTN